jgi:hypothetical protein
MRISLFTAGCAFILLSFSTFSTILAKSQALPFKVIAFYTDYNNMGDGGHRSFSREANSWFPTVAAANGFTYESTTNWGNLNANFLSNYKVIMFFDNLPGDANQRTAFQTYMTNGGAWIGYHVSAFNQNPSSWDWYFNKFLAMGSFMTNTWPPSAPLLLVEDTTHPSTKGLGATFKPADNEWYSWQNDLRKNTDIKILCSIDKSAYPVGTQGVFTWNGTGYVPVVWTNKNYKMLYMNMGHNRDGDVGTSTTFTNANMAKLVLNTIKWLGGATTVSNGGPWGLKRGAPVGSRCVIRATGRYAVVSSGIPGKITAEVSDPLGRTVARSSGPDGKCLIDRSALTQGFYFLRVSGSEESLTRKICLE